MTVNLQMGARDWAMLVTLSVLWGGSYFLVGTAVTALPPLTIVTCRVGLAAITLWVIALASGYHPPRQLNIWLIFLAMGLLNNVVPFVLIVWAQTRVDSGLAAILNAATPIFTVVVAGLFLQDERPTVLKFIGVVLGFAGVAVMIGLPASDNGGTLVAQSALLVAALSYAIAGVYGRRFKAMSVEPIIAAAGQVTASTLVMIPVTLAVDGIVDPARPGVGVWTAVIALAIFSTAAAYILYFRILASTGATNLLLVTLLIPVTAIVLGSIFLKEVLEPAHYAGMVIIALGLSAIDGRLWQRMVQRHSR